MKKNLVKLVVAVVMMLGLGLAFDKTEPVQAAKCEGASIINDTYKETKVFTTWGGKQFPKSKKVSYFKYICGQKILYIGTAYPMSRTHIGFGQYVYTYKAKMTGKNTMFLKLK